MTISLSSFYENLNKKAYDIPIPMPTQPVKSKTLKELENKLVKELTEEDFILLQCERVNYTGLMANYRGDLALWQNKQDLLTKQMFNDLQQCLEISLDEPFYSALYSVAYDDSHHAGKEEVVRKFIDLCNFFKPILDKHYHLKAF